MRTTRPSSTTARIHTRLLAGRPPRSSRLKSTQSTPPAATNALSPRWLSDVKLRIGKCITFGTDASQTAEAGEILHTIARDWRELVAGSEGYLTSKERRSLYRYKIVWGNMDVMGHVNNVMYNRFAETSRVEWAQNYAKYVDPDHAEAWRSLVAPINEGLILKRISTEFKFPMKWPDHISVYHKLHSEPTDKTDSFIFDGIILSELHQRPAARVSEENALYDYRRNRKTALRPFMLDVLKETWRLQEETKQRNSARVWDILGRVRQLEVDTWDRDGALEDTGSAQQ